MTVPVRPLRSDPWARADRALRRGIGIDLFPDDDQIRAFTSDAGRTDPPAERAVDEALHGPHGRALLDRVLGPGGVAAVPEAPASLRALCAEFEAVPSWVVPDRVERGAAVWRRWGTMLFAVAGVTTLEMYTEAAVALPLALAGGYAGDSARQRYLETVRFWIEVSEPGALFTPGSAGRATAMRVRVMHVAVRRRVAAHPDWDPDRWGQPISQAWQTATLLGGSIGPALALWPLGHLTTAREIRDLLHFQRYLGHLLGVRPGWFPETATDAARLLLLVLASRVHDAEHRVAAELVESFPAGFAPRPGAGLRERYTHRIHTAYVRLWLFPGTHRRYALPSGLPWVLIPLLRAPAVALAEVIGHLVPPVGRVWERLGSWHRRRWYRTYADAGAGATRAGG